MTITQTVASKLFVGFVAIAMALTLVAPAQAQTEEEMQAQIDQLMETINALQSQLGQSSDGGDTMSGGSSASVCPYTWTRSLSAGASGSDVMALQQFLNSDPMTQVAASGVGSPGQETDYFGGLTGAAVEKFQVKHRDAILTPVGLVNPVPNFGPSTMAHANLLCASAPSMGDGDGDGDGDMMDDDDDMSSKDLQGEGELVTFEIDDDETELQEGEEDVVVMVLTMEAEDGDVLVDRLSFWLTADTGTANEEDEPWDVFDEISLWVDGDKIADFEADDESNWLDDDAGEEEFRFSNLDLVLEEDDETEVMVAVSVANSVDGADTANAADWNLEPSEVRYFDADDVATTEDNLDEMTPDIDGGSEEAHFDIEEEGTDDDADLESSSADPDASTLLVDDGSSESDEFTVFIFDIEVDEDSSDLILTDAFLDVKVINANPAAAITGGQQDVISDIYMTIDGNTEKGDATAAAADEEDDAIALNGGSTTVQYLFEFNDVELEADTDYEVEVSIVFEGQDGNYVNGVTIEVTADSDQSSIGVTDWEVEGLNDDNVLTGSASSETHTLADVIPVISDAEFNVDRNENGDAGTISYEFTMEADGETDLTFTFGDVNNVDGTADDLRFTLSGTDTTIASSTISKVGGDATTNGTTGWTIADGDDATFVLDVTFTTVDAADNGTYRVTVDTIEGLEIDETSDGMSLTN